MRWVDIATSGLSRWSLEQAIYHLSRRLQATGETQSALRQIIRQITIEAVDKIKVFYRSPLCLSVNYPWETFDFYQHGYVIELPLKTK